MTGRELIYKTFELKETQRVPWVPFVGVHGARLIGKTASEYLTSKSLMVEGVSRAISLYDPDGIPVAFDLQVEAEVLGCKLKWSDDNPPAVISHPLKEGIHVRDLEIPGPEDGRIGLLMDVTKELKKQFPGIALYGLVTGPFTLALHLMGTDIFMHMLEDPQDMEGLLSFTKAVALQMSSYYLEAGCDVIALVDPMTSQIDPFSFETFVLPPAQEIFAFIRERGAKSSFFVCGDARQNIGIMCKCQPDNISIDENIPLDHVRDTALEHGISFGGNIKLTLSLLLGSELDSQLDAIECMETGGMKGFILSPGCDLAMDTPVENLQAVSLIVHDAYQREVIRTLSKGDLEEVPALPDGHFREGIVKVDVITLDSVSCAPCQYMVEAVRHAAEEIGEGIEWEEHSIKSREGVKMMKALGIQKIPAICINGEAAFISRIPPKNEIVKRLREELGKEL